MEDGVEEGDAPGKDDDLPKTMAEAFDQAFAQYLAMGMTGRQFWDEDCTLVIPYREAYKLRKEDENRYAWLQGMYIYEALCDVAPILHAFAKNGTTAMPYPNKPYDFEAAKKQSKAESNAQKMDNAVNFMTKLAAQFNRQFKENKAAKEIKGAEPGKEQGE